MIEPIAKGYTKQDMNIPSRNTRPSSGLRTRASPSSPSSLGLRRRHTRTRARSRSCSTLTLRSRSRRTHSHRRSRGRSTRNALSRQNFLCLSSASLSVPSFPLSLCLLPRPPKNDHTK